MHLACLDGAVGPPEKTSVPVTDEGLLRGDGVFEVMRLYGGTPYGLDAHLTRLERSAENLRLPIEISHVRSDIAVLLRAAAEEAKDPVDALLRVLVTRGGRRITLIEPLPEIAESIRLGCVTYAPTRILDQIKSLSYASNMLASRLAKERGFDEALLVTPHGRVLEAPTSTFFWVAQGKLWTPPLGDHVLDSITRRVVIEEMEVSERECTLDDLAGAEEAFLASTIREVQPVSAIEDHDLPNDGPITAEAARRVRSRIAAEVSAARTP